VTTADSDSGRPARPDRPAGAAGPARPAAPERVLIRVPNWLGDAVMALPLLDAARRAWPGARIDAQVHSRVRDLFAGDPRLGALLPVPEKGGASWRAAAAAVRRGRYDLALLGPPSLSSALLVFVGGVPVRVGRRGDRRDLLLTHPLPAGDRTRPQTEQYLELVGHLGDFGPPPALTFEPGDAARAAADGWLTGQGLAGRPFAAVAPGASYGVAKMWPVNNFGETLKALHEVAGVRSVLVGAPSERPLLDAVAEAARGAAVPFPGGSLRDTAALLARARVVVSNDTGALHLARAVGTPVVGLFTSTAPEWTGPAPHEGVALAADVPCRPCFRRECPLPRDRYACLEALRVTTVRDAALRAMAVGAEVRP
jgi:heptosyltransferase-2